MKHGCKMPCLAAKIDANFRKNQPKGLLAEWVIEFHERPGRFVLLLVAIIVVAGVLMYAASYILPTIDPGRH